MTVHEKEQKITLNNVVNVPGVEFFDLILVSRARKQQFQVTIGTDTSSMSRDRTKLIHKKSRQVNSIGVEPQEGLCQAVLRVVSKDQTTISVVEAECT